MTKSNARFKNYKNLYKNVYYLKQGSNEVQIHEYAFSGVNQNNVHHSKKIYEIALYDEQWNILKLQTIAGLVRAKEAALSLLKRVG